MGCGWNNTEIQDMSTVIETCNPPPSANPAISLAVNTWPQWRGVAEAES